MKNRQADLHELKTCLIYVASSKNNKNQKYIYTFIGGRHACHMQSEWTTCSGGDQFSPCVSQEPGLGFEDWWQMPSPHCITLLIPSCLRQGLSLAWSTSAVGQQASTSQDLSLMPSTGIFLFYPILFLFFDRFIKCMYLVLFLLTPITQFYPSCNSGSYKHLSSLHH